MPAGRPKIKIDKNQFEKLCGLQCTLAEIASFFNCSDDTIERWCQSEYKEKFAEVFRQKRGKGQISLRRSQWKLSETNPTMAIWLGKQYLGQRDNIEVANADLSKVDELLKGIKEIATN
jgi:hypothetical protein